MFGTVVDFGGPSCTLNERSSTTVAGGIGEMKGKVAGFLFLGICIILAALLLTNTITPLVSGCVFAVALATLGGLSGGFKESPKSSRQ